MSGFQNSLQNGVQKPLFAPSTQGSQLGDDIDLNEVFADYFISEFDDPLNAYTSSMANYSGAAVAVALAQKQQQVESNAAEAAPASSSNAAEAAPASSSLPTGGIKTSFHTGTAPQPQAAAPPSAPAAAPQPQVPTEEPAAKKAKQDAQQQVGTGLSSRLGFSMVGGQLAKPQQGQVAQPAPAAPVVAAPAPVQPAAAAPAPILLKPAPPTAGVPLPVGVGIRLGGVGGVAPATAQLAPMARPGLPGQFMMWGGMPGGPSGTGMSEQAIAERRQRNREHAKRSRVRKKFMLESLQEQVKELQKENVELRMLVQQKIPQHAQEIISKCCAKNPLFSDPDEVTTHGGKVDKKETDLVKSDFSLMESLTSGQQNFVLSDPRLPDNPIVYASPGFYVLTGYTQEQVLGRNCRFLQGPETDQRAVDIIRTAIANGSDATTCLLNYKADGTPFWNQFFVAALRDSDNCIVNYVGVQCEVDADAGANFLEDKVNSVLPLQNKEEENGEKAGAK